MPAGKKAASRNTPPAPGPHSPGEVRTCQRKEPTLEAADLSPEPEPLWPE